MAKTKGRARAARARKPRAKGNGIETAAMLALDEAPGHLLRRCHQRSREIYESLIGRHGLSRQQFAVLIAMSGNPGASLTHISAATGFDRNTLAEMIGRLAASGYVTRRRSAADARASAIAPTRKGERFVADMMPRAQEVQRRILEPLPPALRPIFVHCLRILLGLDAPPPAHAAMERAALARMQPSVPCGPLLPEPVAARAATFDRADPGRLRRLEESLWRRETRFDRDYMERTLAPDFFEFGLSGRIYTREDIIGMQPGTAPLRYSLRDFKVTPIDRDVALVTYVSEVRAKDVERGNRSSLWRKTSSGWQLSFHQGTAVLREGTVSD
jgi:MarR family transcriptional regulator, lower aerobic nicotinate degradation pathway regulator